MFTLYSYGGSKIVHWKRPTQDHRRYSGRQAGWREHFTLADSMLNTHHTKTRHSLDSAEQLLVGPEAVGYFLGGPGGIQGPLRVDHQTAAH